jgi:hypothetical protein
MVNYFHIFPLLFFRALLFGGAGDSKGPLLLFMGSVLLWGYPMYLLRVLLYHYNLLSLAQKLCIVLYTAFYLVGFATAVFCYNHLYSSNDTLFHMNIFLFLSQELTFCLQVS